MKGNEDIKAGDILICISNEGLSSIGDETLVWGISDKSINTSGSTTGWRSREDFRWHCYRHKPSDTIPEKVSEFLNKVDQIMKDNIGHLARQRKFLSNRIK